jgi:hypothetical protein
MHKIVGPAAECASRVYLWDNRGLKLMKVGENQADLSVAKIVSCKHQVSDKQKDKMAHLTIVIL